MMDFTAVIPVEPEVDFVNLGESCEAIVLNFTPDDVAVTPTPPEAQ